MSDKRDGRILVQLTGNSLANAEMIADALVRSDADLFNIGGGAYWVHDGKLVQVNEIVLPALVSTYIATKTLSLRAGRPVVEFEPVPLNPQLIRAIQTGHDPHPRGGDLRGGKLAVRLPKVDPASVGIAA